MRAMREIVMVYVQDNLKEEFVVDIWITVSFKLKEKNCSVKLYPMAQWSKQL